MKTTINEVEVEYFDFPEAGIFITDSEETFYLKCDRYDIEEWVLKNGSEGSDFTNEKEWFCNYPDGGYYHEVKELNKDAWGDQLRDYAFAFRSEWENRTED
jgi:hypothetical protein